MPLPLSGYFFYDIMRLCEMKIQLKKQYMWETGLH